MTPGPRRPLESWVRRWWHGEATVPGHLMRLLTLPLELLFRAGVALRSRGYDLGALPTTRLPVPVVSVGNLAVGGTGKTPLAAWIAEALEVLEHRPAVVARGYGHDELRLHRRWNPAIPVHADPHRTRAGRRALEGGATMLVLDDGFQHRHLERDLDLVLLSAEHPLPVRLLPRGPYREPLRAIRRADLVVLTRKTADDAMVEAWQERIRGAAPETRLIRLRFRPAGWLTLQGEGTDPPLRPALAVAAVANPETFLDLVRQGVGPPDGVLVFPDHHDYDRDDVEEIARRADGGTVVTTEKDAVKLAEHRSRLGDVRVLRIAPVFEEGEGLLREALEEVGRRPDPASGEEVPAARDEQA